MPTIILASTSASRRAILDHAGVLYKAKAPLFDEVLPVNMEPAKIAETFAYEKARSIQNEENDEIIIGADQVVDLHGTVFGKPETREKAKDMYRKFSGRSHYLRTGVAILYAKQSYQECFVVSTLLKVRDLSEQEIEAYANTDEWIGCAGGYRIEGKGAGLFESIEGDFFNILGLPLLQVLAVLRKLGVSMF